MYYLYIKTHRITGLKYFGYTTQDDYHNYKGSGIHWRNHLKKHGYKWNTEIVANFDNLEEAIAFGLKFSEENDIVKSSKWANLIPENCSSNGRPPGFAHSQETKKRIGKANKGKKHSEETRKKFSERVREKNPFFGKSHTEESKEKNRQQHLGKKLSEETRKKIGRKGADNSMFGKHHTEEAKEKNRQSQLINSKKSWIVIDPNGNEQIIKNMRGFCRENNLDSNHMRKVWQGKYKHHKGWKCIITSS